MTEDREYAISLKQAKSISEQRNQSDVINTGFLKSL